mmetsp:Transcript_17559/g.35259  ORF Transcript_17559/g.35259 Transcript_17559/m.35259 type:complete len:286 (-) Transcript_17559:54-911(-)
MSSVVFLAALVLLLLTSTVVNASGDGFKLLTSPTFLPEEASLTTISPSDTLYIYVWSDSIDESDMKKNKYEIKFSDDRFKGELTSEDGYFKAAINFSDVAKEGGALGQATLTIKLEDGNKNKLEFEDIVFNRVEAAPAENKGEINEEDATGEIIEDKVSTPPTNAPTTMAPSSSPTAFPTASSTPSALPTSSPTPMPSTSPSDPCVPCSNDPSIQMKSMNRTCETWRLTERKCSAPSYAWRKNKSCKLSCYLWGRAYDSDVCCSPDEAVVEEVPATNSTIVSAEP